MNIQTKLRLSRDHCNGFVVVVVEELVVSGAQGYQHTIQCTSSSLPLALQCSQPCARDSSRALSEKNIEQHSAELHSLWYDKRSV